MTQGWLFDPSEIESQGRGGAAAGGVAEATGKRRTPWSYSKSQTLNTCTRRYYYDYFGASRRLATGDPDKPELVRLSQFSTRHLRAGALLHLGIRTFYKKLLGDQEVRAAGLVSWVRTLFESDRAVSRTYCRTGRLPGEGAFDPVVLLEFVRAPQEAESLFESAAERLTNAFRNFLTGAPCAPYRDPALAQEALVEKRFKVEAGDIVVTGQVDFACRMGPDFRIVDWKIGDDAIAAPQSLQLLSYALWATETQGIPLEEVEILQIPLLGQPGEPVRVTSGMVELARSRIIEETQMTGALEEFGREGLASAFTPRDHPKICVACPYRDPCWRGRKVA